MATDAPPRSPQRRWQALCPHCGAPVEFASAASASAICGFCRSTLVREGDALRRIGVSAELIEDYSPLQLGAAGHYSGEGFSIVGRLQLSYEQGSWNEWHALFDHGKSAWLSEDNGSFVMSFEAGLPAPAPAARDLRLGDRITLAGASWSVAALTQASTAAAQGELPHPPAMAGPFLVAELRNEADEVGSLEYGDPAAPRWSIGRPVRIADLAMTGLRTESSRSLHSQGLSCPNCGAALESRLGSTMSIACPQCRAVVDVTKGAVGELNHFVQTQGGEPQIPLGSTGSLSWKAGGPALPWQVVGFQERCDIPEAGSEDETTFWREYLLFNKTEGFVFLVDSEEGWSLVKPLTGAPSARGATISWQGRDYRRKHGYAAKTTYVLGEFYWQVKRDERALVVDYESPAGRLGPKAMLSREQTGQEITWSQGRALEAAEVVAGFQLAADKLPALQRDAAPVSLIGRPIRGLFIAVVLLVLMVAMMRSCSRDECRAYADSFGSNSPEYQQCRRTGGISGSSGGAWGGFSSGGGGHK